MVETCLAAALYGFTCGAVHGLELAARNLVKFPLLVIVTSAICSLAYWVFATFLARGMSFRSVQRLSLRTFHDTSILLAALSPVTLFLAVTFEKPVAPDALGEYPMVLGVNVVLIALCGSIALVRQAFGLLGEHRVPLRRGVLVVLSWLAVSLLAGGQCSWYFRPYFGLAYEMDIPFMLGTAPDFRSATSFYEAVWNLIA